ncbi:MAG: hypothetical protein A2077_05260 [Nitrospirae bacterium GWC2_46_6]|nr:MAG: hypothetical protein A2077_05260 [Nitrospirae bacterium GWC2_46_6]OGW20599.1 MAG: hypothetical protein A2Z82_11175 [Nitrospirae bacterium GWA2_46_11]OGW23674.1 MAG: hypothetical protein A2X55_00500 [Nitrospirae bacterium GWB2_47_37]HAK89914.1 hypothetical protein [Nitrospiraceae bacterium]HCL81959.1 hypothetical protein [Nitrospiraceae bacterium]
MKKILITDDDAELRAKLSEILKEAGYLTDEAASGKEALKKAVSDEFDIVLLDLMMPKMSGMDVLAEIKKVRPRTKVIMITAFATVENAVDAVKKGASDYICKPFKIETLLATIGRVLEEIKFEDSANKLDLDYTFSTLSNQIRRNIIKLLGSKAGMRFVEITKELGIEEEHTKLAFHLRMLKETGIIEQDPEKLYSLTKEGEKIMDYLRTIENYILT